MTWQKEVAQCYLTIAWTLLSQRSPTSITSVTVSISSVCYYMSVVAIRRFGGRGYNPPFHPTCNHAKKANCYCHVNTKILAIFALYKIHAEAFTPHGLHPLHHSLYFRQEFRCSLTVHVFYGNNN